MGRALRAALLAALIFTSSPAFPADAPGPYWRAQGCERGWRSEVAYNRIRQLVHNTHPAVRKARVHRYATCVSTRAKAHHAHEVARRWWRWRHEGPQVYRILLLRDYAWTLGWLARTRSCESGGDYGAVSPGGDYRGAYQFDLGTWGEVGGYGDPADAHPWEQDYRAARLFVKAGPGRWPVCG